MMRDVSEVRFAEKAQSALVMEKCGLRHQGTCRSRKDDATFQAVGGEKIYFIPL